MCSSKKGADLTQELQAEARLPAAAPVQAGELRPEPETGNPLSAAEAQCSSLHAQQHHQQQRQEPRPAPPKAEQQRAAGGDSGHISFGGIVQSPSVATVAANIEAVGASSSLRAPELARVRRYMPFYRHVSCTDSNGCNMRFEATRMVR